MPNVGNFGTLVSLVVLAVTYLIMQPLKQNIAALTRSVDKLSSIIEATDRRVNALSERVAVIESAVKSAHKRIDSIEGKNHD